MSSHTVVTRFAPSPTGFMHVGGIRTALYAFAQAKKNNGTFILRIEDTDKAREVGGSIPHIIESLKWLGITWDEGPDIGGPHAPYLQSERLDSYKKYANILVEKGLAYPDPYTKEELTELRKLAETEKRAFLYRNHRPEKFGVWDGSQSLRFKVTPKVHTWIDVVRGELSAGEEALDDIVLIKSDGYPTYNFAHIIDDLEMGVTHIMRADEFIASMPIYLSLYEALEITPPILATLPPILGKDGTKKLGKRDGAKDILEYREEGYLPSAMLNFLALLGWNPGGEKEIFTAEEFIQSFDISRIHKSGAMFNEEKLLWMNKEHIKLQTKDEQLSHVKKYLTLSYPEELLIRLLPTIVDRVSNYGELVSIENIEFGFFVNKPKIDIEKIVWKDSDKNEAKKHLIEIKEILKDTTFTSVDIIKSSIMSYAESNGKGNVLWPLRYALSGQEKSVDPFTICYVLGKDEVIARINFACKGLDS